MVLFIVEIITQTKRRKNLKCYDVATGKTKWILQCSSEEEFSINCIEVIYIYKKSYFSQGHTDLICILFQF